MYLGIEIGGTKLQLAIGRGDGSLSHTWRGSVELASGAAGIRAAILDAVPILLREANRTLHDLRAVGIGFGGPVDDSSQCVITSHQIDGWDDFPLAQWLGEAIGKPVVIGNDADIAGLAEAHLGAGNGMSPIFYITIGSGIGGGLIIDGSIYRGVGRGAAEIGHLRFPDPDGPGPWVTLESIASGWGIGRRARTLKEAPLNVNAAVVAQAAVEAQSWAIELIHETSGFLADAICQVIALLCPRRIVIGGGVSLMGDTLFVPLRHRIAERVFRPFAGLTEIVPAQLGEAVVLHGAIVLARQTYPT